MSYTIGCSSPILLWISSSKLLRSESPMRASMSLFSSAVISNSCPFDIASWPHVLCREARREKKQKQKHYLGLGEPLLSLKQSFIPFISGIAHLTFDLFWIGFLSVLSPISNLVVRYRLTFSEKRTPPVLPWSRAYPVLRREFVPLTVRPVEDHCQKSWTFRARD